MNAYHAASQRGYPQHHQPANVQYHQSQRGGHVSFHPQHRHHPQPNGQQPRFQASVTVNVHSMHRQNVPHFQQNQTVQPHHRPQQQHVQRQQHAPRQQQQYHHQQQQQQHRVHHHQQQYAPNHNRPIRYAQSQSVNPNMSPY